MLRLDRNQNQIIIMENQDSLDRTAHVFGMTDIEIEERQAVLADLANQQVIRQRMEDEENETENE